MRLAARNPGITRLERTERLRRGRAAALALRAALNADASHAMQALNGTDFDGRPLKVNEAQDRERSAGGGNREPRRY